LTRQIKTILLFSALMAGCNPARVLIINTEDRPGASVTIYANNNILPPANNFVSDGPLKKIKILVPDSGTANNGEKLILFGSGSWKNPIVKQLSENIDSIIVGNSKKRIVLKQQREIEKYLLKHRHGLFRHVLTIRAK
jgi:hypothetical protein